MYYVTIGKVCQILDEAKVDYHHCMTWFRLFLDKSYGVTIKEKDLQVIVYECDENKNINCFITPSKPKVFDGNVDDFKQWLYTMKLK